MLFTQKSEVDIHEMSPLALAFVGDAVLELLVRARLVGTTRLQPNRLHTVATHYVSAHAQNLELDIIEPMLTDAEAAVLRRGTTAHRDMRSIAAELDRLYGASIAYTVRKKGENQCLGFVGSFLDERYVPGGERLLEPMADLLGELLLDPLTRNGRFLSDYVESEKENLIDAIESILNDKRDYADARLLQEMCRGERYGMIRFGSRVDLYLPPDYSAVVANGDVVAAGESILARKFQA